MSQRIHVTTYFLQMFEAPAGNSLAAPPQVQVEPANTMSSSQYREIYNEVGAPWLWYERSDLSDAALDPLIQDPAVSIFTLQCGGEIAGFTELRKGDEKDLQILYFGLRPKWIGKGLGTFFLDWTVRYAFARKPERLWVHTCSLDHPRALATYHKVGFSTFRQESGWVTIPAAAVERMPQSHRLRIPIT